MSEEPQPNIWTISTAKENRKPVNASQDFRRRKGQHPVFLWHRLALVDFLPFVPAFDKVAILGKHALLLSLIHIFDRKIAGHSSRKATVSGYFCVDSDTLLGVKIMCDCQAGGIIHP